jgi:predicted nucleic-acid-binding protein
MFYLQRIMAEIINCLLTDRELSVTLQENGALSISLVSPLQMHTLDIITMNPTPSLIEEHVQFLPGYIGSEI